jgi:nitronate monooxygenase
MSGWPDRRILDLFGIELPIVLAPMAGPGTAAMAIAVSEAGGLGSMPCAQLDVAGARAALQTIRGATSKPYNVNFFAHTPPRVDPERERAWRARLSVYYAEHGLERDAATTGPVRKPFDSEFCEVIEEFRPPVVSFHFGLPDRALLDRVRAAGAKILGCATTVAEARWLEARGCDAVIAMGAEAGGHRGCFLSTDPARQIGTIALVPQVVDAVNIPVIAAGGIADGRGLAAALMLGAAAAQIGTAYLFCREAGVSPLYRRALEIAGDDETVITNVFTGRPARGILNRIVRELGPICPDAPEFPLAASPLAPLRARAEAAGSADFTNLWSGQAARLAARDLPAGELTRMLASEAIRRLSGDCA